MRLQVFPNWFPYNDMLLDGHLQVGKHGVKTRNYDWKYRGPMVFYTSLRTAQPCVRAYNYTDGKDKHRVIIGAATLQDVRLLTDQEVMKMTCNFNNLTARQVRADFDRAEVVPFDFGWFFTDIKRFSEPVPFHWPSGPVRPMFTEVQPRSPLARQLRAAGIKA